MNPALQGARELPGGDTNRAAQDRAVPHRPAAALQGLRGLDRRLVVGALALLALLGAGTVLVWPHLAQREAPVIALPLPGAVSPPISEPVAPAPAERAVAQTPAPPVQEPVPVTVAQPAPAPPIVESIVLRTLLLGPKLTASRCPRYC